MGSRYWLWLGARLVVAGVILVWAASYVGTGSGEKELQKTVDAMKKVRTFRAVYAGNAGVQHNELLFEIDCDRNILHRQQHYVSTNPPNEMRNDELMVGAHSYNRNPDGSWQDAKYSYQAGSAQWVCSSLAQGTENNVLPPIVTMIKRGIIQEGDKKTVNGVRCREWKVTMKGGFNGLEHDTVCLGLEDHLPYEMTVDWDNSRSTFSDFNAPVRIDVPEVAVQPVNAAGGSN